MTSLSISYLSIFFSVEVVNRPDMFSLAVCKAATRHHELGFAFGNHVLRMQPTEC